ncbi:DUF2752 domain-containing protein, partial [Streptomyces lycii]
CVGVVDPNEPGHYPVCPLLHHTGILCPGCGGLRGAHALAHGDPVAAAQANLLLVAALLALSCLWAGWAVRCLRRRPGAPAFVPAPVVAAARACGRARTRWRRPAWAAAALLVVVFTVVRNLPAGGWLAP